MELARTKNWFYIALACAMGFILILGAWWLYLVFKLSVALEGVQQSVIPANLALMVKWEGLSFFALTTAVGFAVFYIFWQDHKKTKSLQTFYATLTHELKTPLASMRLQSQVLGELIESLSIEKQEMERVQRYSQRLQQDVHRLESELDKHLHLSRIEGGGNLNQSSISLVSLINSQRKNFPDLGVRVETDLDSPTVLGDQTALSIIFKNLFENTSRHSKCDFKQVDIKIRHENDEIILSYDDHGNKFSGDTRNLGKLFFKHNSPKGSGIGLYLIKKLARAQGGRFIIKNNPRLLFELKLQREKELE